MAAALTAGSPRGYRAWPLAWPSPSGPLGWQRSPGSTARRRRVPRSGMRSTVEAGGASRDNARRSDPADWTPRELRHSFVSLLSDAGVPVEKIARLVGHAGTATTEIVYRKQIRPVVMGGAEVMDSLFPKRDTDA